MHTVAALGHVRGRPALEVAVIEARDLLEKGEAQARFEPPTQAQQAGGDGEVEEQ